MTRPRGFPEWAHTLWPVVAKQIVYSLFFVDRETRSSFLADELRELTTAADRAPHEDRARLAALTDPTGLRHRLRR